MLAQNGDWLFSNRTRNISATDSSLHRFDIRIHIQELLCTILHHRIVKQFTHVQITID